MSGLEPGCSGQEAGAADKTEPWHYGFLGRPGSQMVVPHIFYLDSIYKTATLSETKDKYILKYQFEDNAKSGSTDIFKHIELDKTNFFSTKITESYTIFGNKAVHQISLSKVKINDEVRLL